MNIDIELALLRDEILHEADDKSHEYQEGLNRGVQLAAEHCILLLKKYFRIEKP